MNTRSHNICIRPPYLEEGDLVALVAPAGRLAPEVVERAVIELESWGVRVLVGQNALDTDFQFAGTDKARAADLQFCIDRTDVSAIICLRGGYGSIRTLAHLDCSPLLQHPKWLVGFSDITVFHALLNCHLGLESLHASMPINFSKEGEANEESTKSLRRALFGQLTEYRFSSHALNIQGRASGRLIGGNLSILQSIAATPVDIVPDGAILFLEDLNEYLYHIDRMMMNLVASGKLSRIAGLLVGGFTNCKDNEQTFGKDAYEIMMDYARPLGIPVAVDFPAGHQERNLAMYFGRTVTLSVATDEVAVYF